MGKTHIIRIFVLESYSEDHDPILQNPLIHILKYSEFLESLDIQKIAEYFQCSVCLMCKYTLCENLTKLNTFLIEAVDIP